MYLAKIRVRNFRNLGTLVVELEPGLNVIVGENNIGKTNLLDAVRVALGPASLAGFPPRLDPDDIHRNADGQQVEDPISVDLTFANLDTAEQAEFLECLNYNAAAPAKSTASIHYEWSWSDTRRRYFHRRWGSERTTTETAVPDDTLQSIRVILLDALRDAQSALAPGRDSRLGHLLTTVASDEDRKRIEGIFAAANSALENDEALIQPAEVSITKVLESASGAFSQTAAIRAHETKFDRIVNGLRLLVQITGTSKVKLLSELRSNGLGYNNLLYIGTVLAELAAAKDATLPMLLVEEPEAHLHPQLQTLLADFLGNSAPVFENPKQVQSIVTTHSPTIAAHVAPSVIRVLHNDEKKSPRCISIGACGLEEPEIKRLQRMFDVTKATLLFSRGVVLVEGITEQLLLPVLAKRLGKNLAKNGVSVVSLAGVSFSTIAKLFGPNKLRFPVSIITDADPKVTYPIPWREAWFHAVPECDDSGKPKQGERLANLLDGFASNDVVEVFPSSVTLEYDLALAGLGNAEVIFDAWESLYERKPRTLKRKDLVALKTPEERALALWRAVCVAQPSHGKAELAQALAEKLDETNDDGEYIVTSFHVPEYLVSAVKHALPQENGDGANEGAG